MSAFHRRRGPPPKPAHRINEWVRVPKVRLIDEEGNQLGVVLTLDARKMARDKHLDLVEISPTASPPVCKIMDYGRFKYEDKKRKAESKKKQHQIQVKELRIRPTTGVHDVDVKLRKARQFLEEGDKVSITVRFRGREVVHSKFGVEVLEKFARDLEDVGKVERPPRMEGRRMNMIIVPVKRQAGQKKS